MQYSQIFEENSGDGMSWKVEWRIFLVKIDEICGKIVKKLPIFAEKVQKFASKSTKSSEIYPKIHKKFTKQPKNSKVCLKN